MRPLPNGDVFAPRRGYPPPAPEGYDRDTGDPFLYHPILTACQYRVEKSRGCEGCSGTRIYKWCDRDNQQVYPGDCKECQDGLRPASV